MITLKKRPLLTRPKPVQCESDSEEESENSEEAPLPVVSSDFRASWRKEKVNDGGSSFFVLDTGDVNGDPADVDDNAKQTAEKVSEKLSDSVEMDGELKTLLDKAVCGPQFEKNYAGTAKLIGRRQLKRLRKHPSVAVWHNLSSILFIYVSSSFILLWFIDFVHTGNSSYNERLAQPLVDTTRLYCSVQAEREKTKGRDWFDLPATELTEEAKADLELLQMRSAIDPLAFYRRNDRAVLPKYFQVGRVVDAPEDYYSGRMTKKERKRNMLDELLHNQQFTRSKRERYVLITRIIFFK
ncbi:unnamed protein product [Nippostrongylus brasiliensis]|uniref:Fcf2 domain-containing protein n=1 Tax=Nippostrongylus brasiliensis TaxID=27835 RepID=A0A0N4YXF0_NIPBR|nr:unnamed protein product [Nippostrongylus brasiliensis]